VIADLAGIDYQRKPQDLVGVVRSGPAALA